jgi:hypothetical protein
MGFEKKSTLIHPWLGNEINPLSEPTIVAQLTRFSEENHQRLGDRRTKTGVIIGSFECQCGQAI